MRIWLITVGEPLGIVAGERPWRTGLLARELARRGHQVTWWTSRLDHFTKRAFSHPDRLPIQSGLDVLFLEGIPYRRNISVRRFVNHLQLARHFADRARREPPPELIVASLPALELARAAVRFGAAHDVPVIVDVRDLWPDEMYAQLPGPLRWLGPAVFFPLDRMADEALAGATAVVATSDSYLRWAQRRGGREPSQRDLVLPHGYPDPAVAPVDPSATARAGERLRAAGVDPSRAILWFVGTFVGSIDLGTAIGAAAAWEASGRTDIQLVLSGSGEREREWRALAAGLESVVFTGWIDQVEMRWLAEHAVAGLAAYKSGALMSVTNKLVEYLGFGLPVISSLQGDARTLLEEGDCGVTYAPGEEQALRAAVAGLLADPSRRRQMGANARGLFELDFRADVVYSKYADHIERIRVSSPSPP